MATPHNEKTRILLVEDDEDTQELVPFQLPQYRFTTAHNFAEGLRQARQRYFDLYILDNWLPDRSGVELCKSIREFDPHTPILFYSAAAYEWDVQMGLRAGAQIYLVKPVTSVELEWAVEQLVSDARRAAVEAQLAEFTAIKEETAIRHGKLAIRSEENAWKTEEAKGKFLRANERALRARVMLAFLAARGTRGDFARQWKSMYLEDARRKRNGKFG